MPNRSMVKKALRLSRAGYSRPHNGVRRGGVDGSVTFVAIFPPNALGSDVPQQFAPNRVATEAAAIMSEGLRPVTPRVWWKPDDPADPSGTGIAVVRLDDYGYDEDRVYVHRVQPGDSVDVETMWDKPHRVRWAEDRPAMVTSGDPAVIRATRLMFDVIYEANGFLPDMTGWMSGLYGGRWFVAAEWDPWDGYDGLRGVVSLMDAWRRDYHADVRLYGTHAWHCRFEDGRTVTGRTGNEPYMVHAGDAGFLVTSMRAFWNSPRDEETWRLFSREP